MVCPLEGVMNGPLKFLTARKILLLLDLLAKYKRVLACLCSQTFCEWDGYPEYCIVRSLTVIGKNVKCSIRD